MPDLLVQAMGKVGFLTLCIALTSTSPQISVDVKEQVSRLFPEFSRESKIKTKNIS